MNRFDGDMRWQFLDDCVVVWHSAVNPPESVWDTYVEELRRAKVATFLVHSTGGGPSGRQRAALNAALEGRTPRIALMTNSTVVRGMLTALSWMGWSDAKPFSPADLDAAIDYLRLSPEQAKSARVAMDELSGRHSGVHGETRRRGIS